MRWFILLLCSGWMGTAVGAEPNSAIQWERNDRAAFQQAKSQQRFVLLYLEAVWCHWCHVMDTTTYADPVVQALLSKHYVPLRIDQDSRPDLANRYRDFGWPATVVFAADGTEIVKRRGFVSKERFARLLQAIVDDPSPEHLLEHVEQPSSEPLGELTAKIRTQLLARHARTYDPEHGGLRTALKAMDRDQVEFLLWQAAGDPREDRTREAQRRARRSLDGAAKLLDPVWGGVYQYSTGGDWSHPHFEKLTRLQAEYLRMYSLACAQLQHPSDCAAARSILAYLRRFQRAPDGSYYTAQDADLRPGEHAADYFALGDEARVKLGTPRIDRHVYARENGRVIEALASWYEATGERAALRDAQRAAHRMLQIRALPGGGFAHDRQDTGGPYLADTLAMGRAFLALYRADANRQWLQHASAAADFIEQRFRAPSAWLTAVQGDAPIAPLPDLDEVLSLTRFCNLLSHYSGKTAHQRCAHHGMAWLAREDIALSRLTDAGILLADAELARQPVHLTIRGGKSQAPAAALYAAALRIPAGYKRLDWWDDAEGPLPNPDVAYPKLERPAAFFCTERSCSLPLHTAAELQAYWDERDVGVDAP
jgi:hypothetical protein